MKSKIIHKLPFLKIHKHTFDLIKGGRKKIETRAGNPEYLQIREGDSIEFSCGNEKIIRKVKKVSHYKNLDNLLSVYKSNEINPEISSSKKLKQRYIKFPKYKQRIKEYGILVFELEEI